MLYTSTYYLVGRSTVLSRAIERVRGVVKLRLFRRSEKSDVSVVAEPRRLTVGEQWNSLSKIIRGSLAGAEEATRCHKSAALQIDLAQYALTSLIDELSAVMDVGGRRRLATVHVLDVQPPPVAPYPFDDAIAA
jgi:hypothetical protein